MKLRYHPQTCSGNRARLLECGNSTGRARRSARAAWLSVERRARSDAPYLESAFTLTELLVVIAILALLAATQLPALTGAKSPARFTQCQNNLRQIGQSVLLYKADNNDAFPYGNRVSGPGTGSGSVVDPSGWPMQLLRYLGGYKASVQPPVYLCPSETTIAVGWSFQMHYLANRQLLTDTSDLPAPITGAKVGRPSLYWMFKEKGPAEFCNVRPGGLQVILISWNVPPGSPGYRRHNRGTSSTAADGHVEWLRMPPYRPGSPPPGNFLELGDCANGQNPGSTWPDDRNLVKLFARESTQGFGGGTPGF